MANNGRSRTRNRQLVVSGQPDTEDAMSAGYLSSDNDSTTDDITMDTYNHKVQLKKARHENKSLMELAGDDKGHQLADIETRFHTAIYNYITKIRYVFKLAEYVEKQFLHFIRIEALVTALEYQGSAAIKYDKEVLLQEKRKFWEKYDRLKSIACEHDTEEELDRVINEMQDFRSMPIGYY